MFEDRASELASADRNLAAVRSVLHRWARGEFPTTGQFCEALVAELGPADAGDLPVAGRVLLGLFDATVGAFRLLAATSADSPPGVWPALAAHAHGVDAREAFPVDVRGWVLACAAAAAGVRLPAEERVGLMLELEADPFAERIDLTPAVLAASHLLLGMLIAIAGGRFDPHDVVDAVTRSAARRTTTIGLPEDIEGAVAAAIAAR